MQAELPIESPDSSVQPQVQSGSWTSLPTIQKRVGDHNGIGIFTLFGNVNDRSKDKSYAAAAAWSDGQSTCADGEDDIVDLSDQSDGEWGSYEEFSNVIEN